MPANDPPAPGGNQESTTSPTVDDPRMREPGETPYPSGAAAGESAWPSLEDFEVQAEVGRGGMGIVYRARQVSLDRVVALKVIRRERLSHPEAVRRFRREAQAAARLSHQNIVHIFDADRDGDTHYLVMEFVDGPNLQRLVEDHGPLPAAQACDYARQAAQGLRHAEEQSLVHRDIKPSNLMVTAPPEEPAGPRRANPYHNRPGALVKILDMGVARLYQVEVKPEESLSTLTQDGTVIGTPDYIAPEQLEDAHGADIRADLYSLGCTLYYLVTGQVPFPGGTLIQKLDRQRWEMPVPADRVRPGVPAAVAAVIERLMAKKPADRYQTPAELIEALEELTRTGRLPAEPRPAAARERLCLKGHTDGVCAVAFSPDGRRLLSGGKDRTLRLWDVAGAEARLFPGQIQEVRAVAFSPDGRLLLSASGASLRLWDAETGEEVRRFVGHTGTVQGAVFSADGERILSGGADRTARLWDARTGQELRRLGRLAGDVTAVALAPDGRQALIACRDQALHRWEFAEGEEHGRLEGGRGLVLAVAFSPDGSQALSGHFDRTLRLWDVAAGRELRRLQGHSRMVSGVAFAPDGRRALSASHDGTVRLWDLDTARELCRAEGHAGAVAGIAVAPDGRLALSGGADGTVRVWELPERPA